MEGAGAHFHVVGLHHHAALLGPVLLEGEDQILEGAHGGLGLAQERSPVEAATKNRGVYRSRTHPAGRALLASPAKTEAVGSYLFF